MQQIIGAVKQYHWGKQADESAIGRLLHSAKIQNKFNLDSDKPLAEYWLGTHSNGKLRFLDKSVVDDYPTLGFLFKILSINEPLSIQLHPDRPTAVQLHAEDPSHYPDPNPKPEMVIALTEFRALCGFRSIEDIRKLFISLEPLQAFCQEDDDGSAKKLPTTTDDLKWITTKILGSQADVIKRVLQECKEAAEKAGNLDAIKLSVELSSYYEGDPGVLLSLLLEEHHLNPGDSLFLDAFLPHAYLPGGEAVEVMACSDNVIRAALTPKFRDLARLLSLMSFDRVQKLTPTRLPFGISVYCPVGVGFRVRTLDITTDSDLPIHLPKLSTLAVMICVRGCCTVTLNDPPGSTILEGQSFLLKPGSGVTVLSVGTLPLLIFQAYGQ